MRNRLKIITAVMLTLIFCMQPVCNIQATEESNLSEAQQEKKTLENDLQKAKELIDSLKGSKEDIQSEVEKLDKQLNEISGKVKELESQLSKKRQEIADTESALNKAKEQEKKQYRNMKKRIQFMYENGQTSYVEMLLSADSFTDFLNAVEYITQISQYDRKMLKEYQATREKINQKEQDLETEHSNLLALQESTEAKQASVKELMSSKQKELTSYNSQIGAAQSSIDQYNADIKAQENQMKAIEAEMKRKEEEARKKAEAQKKTYNVTNLGNISFKWPCPSSGRITSGFGGRKSPTKGASSNHQGIDISASTGASIVAAADGTVVIATYSYSAGNYIMIDHGGGVSTVYMHCSQLLASQGQKVKKGQTIARVGSTGYSTGSHLHFGVRSGGSYVNPSKYVSP